MTKTFAKSTLARLRASLEEEQQRLRSMIATIESNRESARLSEAAAEHSTDPDNVDGGALAAELEKELSLEQNAVDLLEKVDYALGRFDTGSYGVCENCGERIPLARLEALPYVTLCVTCASNR